MAPGAGVDLVEVVDDLMRLAQRSEALDCPAGYAGARMSLLAAVRIDALRPAAAGEAEADDEDDGLVLEMNLTGEQWRRKHAKPHLIEMGQWDHKNDCQMGWSPLGGAG